MRLAYLFSRYPIVSQTFCDTEILALERMGVEFEIYSIYPPPTSFRHGHAARMKAELHYAPSSSILKLHEAEAKKAGTWPAQLIAEHDRKYGPEYKAALRARNALYFANLFKERGVTHFHVHFANRAAHTAIFVKAISGIPFSISTHGQDFMVDLGNNDLLREICREADFVANETEFSKNLVASLCPDSAGKMVRVFNGMDLSNFPAPTSHTQNAVPRIVSTGRLIEFKGFHHLIAACGKLRDRGLNFACDIIGEGPWRPQLQAQIDQLGLGGHVRLTGSLPQEEVFAALRNCDIFALACIVDRNGASDVFPTVILEAMASAKPVVSTYLAGVPEQIVNEETGLLVQPGDEPALADALGRLIESAELRQQYGDAARRRLETEFAVERTVQPLKALFEQYVKPRPPRERQAAGIGYLLHEWPAPTAAENELRQLREAFPGLQVYAVHATSAPVPASALPLLPAFEYLPDGMVLEGEWQQERELARRMETWRSDLGQKLSSETFLLHARYALYLRRWIQRDGVRHLHAAGGTELLTAWMLRKLCGVSISVTLSEQTGALPADVAAKLARECAGVRFTDKNPAVADSLGKGSPAPHLQPPTRKSAKLVEPEWLTKLSEWSAVSLKTGR